MYFCYHYLHIEKPQTVKSGVFLKCTCISRAYFCLYLVCLPSGRCP
nr:MAG TPA: hypothetical protein [Caudoviricetes sp.]